MEKKMKLNKIKGMCIIFSIRQDFGTVIVKSLIMAKNESVQIAPKMKSYYEYHIGMRIPKMLK